MAFRQIDFQQIDPPPGIRKDPFKKCPKKTFDKNVKNPKTFFSKAQTKGPFVRKNT